MATVDTSTVISLIERQADPASFVWTTISVPSFVLPMPHLVQENQ